MPEEKFSIIEERELKGGQFRKKKIFTSQNRMILNITLPKSINYNNLTENQKKEMVRNYISLNKIDDYRIPIKQWVKNYYSIAIPYHDISDAIQKKAIKEALEGEDRLDERTWYDYCFIDCLIKEMPPSQWLLMDLNEDKIVDLMDSIEERGLDEEEPISIMVKDSWNEMYCLGGNHRLLALNILYNYKILNIEKIPCLLVIDK